MARARKHADPLDIEIVEIHRRYIQVMEDMRLETISVETKQRYLQMIRNLTEKLEIPSKPLSEVVGEIMAEAAPLLFQAMQR